MAWSDEFNAGAQSKSMASYKMLFYLKNNKKLAASTKLLLKSIIMVFQSLFIITMKIFLLMTMQNLANKNLSYTV